MKTNINASSTPAYYKTLFENAPDGILITTKQLVVIDTNKAFEEMSSIPREQLIGRNALYLSAKYAPKESIKGLMTIIAKSLAGKSCTSMEVEYKGKILSLSTEIKTDPKYSIGIIRDVTEEKKRFERADESENKYKTLVDSSNDGLIILQDGVIKYVNPKAIELSSYDEEVLLGQQFHNFVRDEDKAKLFNNYKKRMAGEKVPNYYEIQIQIQSGKFRHVELSVVPITYKGNLAQQIILRDVTEQKKAKEDLIIKNQELEKAKRKAEESDNLKSAFLANMSHEIRTPMNGILGFTSILKESDLSREKQLEYIDIIQKSGFRMLNTINDLINISKIESGQMKMVFSEIDVNYTINELRKFFQLECSYKGIELIMSDDLNNGTRIIKTDSDKFNAILTNLIKNAIKFTSKGFIEIGYVVKGKDLEFYVRDTGIGVSKQKQSMIFNRFVQVENEDSRSYEGSGLGLSIAKSYVKMLGGKIGIKSKENEGSTFYFTHPISL